MTFSSSIAEMADLRVRAEAAEHQWQQTIGRLEASSRVVVRVTAERDTARADCDALRAQVAKLQRQAGRGRRFGWCGVCVSGVLAVVLMALVAGWWLR